MTIVRSYELVITGNLGPRTTQHRTRDVAEQSADDVVAAGMLLGHRYEAVVWAVIDEGAYQVYRLEPTPRGLLVTRLRARLRHAAVTNAQRLLLMKLQAGPVQLAELESSVKYSNNTIMACLERGWIEEPRIQLYTYKHLQLTDLGRVILAELDDAPFGESSCSV